MVTGCAAHMARSRTPIIRTTPIALRPCDERVVRIDHVNVALVTNLDGSLASATALPPAAQMQRSQALGDIARLYGSPHPDPRTLSRPWKWGLLQTTDACGRLVRPQPLPSP